MRDLPLILGLLAVAVLGFWSVGHLASRGKLAGSGGPVLKLLVVAMFCGQAAIYALEDDWTGAMVVAGVAAIYALIILSSWRRRRRARRI